MLIHATLYGDLVNQVALQVSRLCIVDFVVLLGIQATEHVGQYVLGLRRSKFSTYVWINVTYI